MLTIYTESMNSFDVEGEPICLSCVWGEDSSRPEKGPRFTAWRHKECRPNYDLLARPMMMGLLLLYAHQESKLTTFGLTSIDIQMCLMEHVRRLLQAMVSMSGDHKAEATSHIVMHCFFNARFPCGEVIEKLQQLPCLPGTLSPALTLRAMITEAIPYLVRNTLTPVGMHELCCQVRTRCAEVGLPVSAQLETFATPATGLLTELSRLLGVCPEAPTLTGADACGAVLHARYMAEKIVFSQRFLGLVSGQGSLRPWTRGTSDIGSSCVALGRELVVRTIRTANLYSAHPDALVTFLQGVKLWMPALQTLPRKGWFEAHDFYRTFPLALEQDVLESQLSWDAAVNLQEVGAVLLDARALVMCGLGKVAREVVEECDRVYRSQKVAAPEVLGPAETELYMTIRGSWLSSLSAPTPASVVGAVARLWFCRGLADAASVLDAWRVVALHALLLKMCCKWAAPMSDVVELLKPVVSRAQDVSELAKTTARWEWEWTPKCMWSVACGRLGELLRSSVTIIPANDLMQSVRIVSRAEENGGFPAPNLGEVACLLAQRFLSLRHLISSLGMMARSVSWLGFLHAPMRQLRCDPDPQRIKLVCRSSVRCLEQYAPPASEMFWASFCLEFALAVLMARPRLVHALWRVVQRLIPPSGHCFLDSAKPSLGWYSRRGCWVGSCVQF